MFQKLYYSFTALLKENDLCRRYSLESLYFCIQMKSNRLNNFEFKLFLNPKSD